MNAFGITVAIDPGLACTGWSWWTGGMFRGGGIVRGGGGTGAVEVGRLVGRTVLEAVGVEHKVDRVVYERMAVYKFTSQKGDQNDLILLAEVAGAACGVIGALADEPVTARSWKGQVPKDIMHARVLGRLTQEEAAAVDGVKTPGGLRHNFLDAVGIGLWRAGRL